jgi:hypothetical protein
MTLKTTVIYNSRAEYNTVPPKMGKPEMGNTQLDDSTN